MAEPTGAPAALASQRIATAGSVSVLAWFVESTGLACGSGISLGHPIGATGALITVKALYELERINGRYALVTMCIGGGQGIAAIFERQA